MANPAKILFLPPPDRAARAARPAGLARREPRVGWVVGALIVGALGLFWAGATLSVRDDREGIRRLPPVALQALYARTLDDLTTACTDDAAASGSLRDHCIAQARFVMQLPACGAECQRAAARMLPHAHR